MPTVREVLEDLSSQYENDVLNSELNSSDAAFQKKVRSLLTNFEQLWSNIQSHALFSKNEELEEMSTGALRLLVIPYIIGDLRLRIVDLNFAASPSGNGQGPSAATTSSASGAAGSPADSYNRRRIELLQGSSSAFNEFFRLMIQIGVTKEEEVEQHSRHNPSNRMVKIALGQRQKELGTQLSQLQAKLGYTRAKSKRLRELMAASGDEEGDGSSGGVDVSSEEEDMLRKYAITKLQWCLGNAFQTIQISQQEMEMLMNLTDSAKLQASRAYQEGIAAAQRGENPTGRHTYTILPGGMIMPGSLSGSSHAPMKLDPITSLNTTDRLAIRDEAFIERNRPTMTLQEFAEMEMEKMAQDATRTAERQREQAEEDARLGEEGIEERQRKKDSAWDDWKDDHPPIGITTKGNYS
jgi:hypothetical protein